MAEGVRGGIARLLVSTLVLAVLSTAAEASSGRVDRETASRFAALALDCVHREYPNKIAHVLASDDDARPPRELTPAFKGCYDWHSAVHGHWLLARLARQFPESEFAPEALRALAISLTPEKLAAEAAYLAADGRQGFERPYGLAWLLQLAAELHEWQSVPGGELAAVWREALEPLEKEASARLASWIPKLTHPIRIGEHAQTAFAFGLILDWARTVGDHEMEALLVERSLAFHEGDRACPLAYEPSGHDFLSPCIAEADLMRRVLEPEAFAAWLTGFLPGIPATPEADWLPPAVVSDRSDGKLAHLDGLNLSRAWMLEGVATALAATDPRRAALEAAVEAHRVAGLASVTGEHYEGGHWLGSFATYLETARGLPADPRSD